MLAPTLSHDREGETVRGLRGLYFWGALAFAVIVIGGRSLVYQIESAPLGPIGYSLNALVQLAAACACWWRALRSPGSYREGWLFLGFALFVTFIATTYQLISGLLGQLNTNSAVDLVLLAVSILPLIFILSSPETHPTRVRVLDGLASVVLAALFYEFIHQVLLPGDQLDADGVNTLIWMFDIQNGFLTAFALLRFTASREAHIRNFFASLTIFAFLYGASAAITNRFLRGSAIGGTWDFLYDIPGLALTILAFCLVLPAVASGRGNRFSRVVKEVIPLVLPISLLALSWAMTMHNMTAAIMGGAAALVIYAARMIQAVLYNMDERDRYAAISSVDALTGLANRRRFDESLHLELSRAGRTDGVDEKRRGRGLAVLMIDIDHFKLLNDRFGHQVGDERLRAVGQALSSYAGRAGDLVARYGGEEFVATFADMEAEAAFKYAQKICADIRELCLPSPTALGFLTVSIGVAWADDIGTVSGTQLIEQADQALYASKNAGRDRVTAFWKMDVASTT